MTKEQLKEYAKKDIEKYMDLYATSHKDMDCFYCLGLIHAYQNAEIITFTEMENYFSQLYSLEEKI